MKKVVYSCLFSNNKKRLDQPNITTKLEGFDYVMFTNVPDYITNTDWIPIYKDLIDDDPIYTAKYYKWIAHKYLSCYDIGIYVDAYMMPNPHVNWSLYENKLDINDVTSGILLMKHPERNCIYQECNAIVACRKDTRMNMNKVIEFLKTNNMPTNYGLSAGGLFMRHLKNEHFNKLCEELYELMLKFSYRDQSLLSYVFWKNNIKINTDFTNEFYCVSGIMGDHNYI